MPSRIRPGYEVSARVGPYVLEQIGDKNGVPSTSQPSKGDPKKKNRKVLSSFTGGSLVLGAIVPRLSTLGEFFGKCVQNRVTIIHKHS
jgi:hypothetical protein